MKLGKKLAEGVAVDLEAQPVTATPEPRTEPGRVEAAQTAEPARAEVRVERDAEV